jgi:hypothetical protein
MPEFPNSSIRTVGGEEAWQRLLEFPTRDAEADEPPGKIVDWEPLTLNGLKVRHCTSKHRGFFFVPSSIARID